MPDKGRKAYKNGIVCLNRWKYEEREPARRSKDDAIEWSKENVWIATNIIPQSIKLTAKLR
jgi:hypothetical protein